MTSKEALRNIAGHLIDFNEEICTIEKDLEQIELLELELKLEKLKVKYVMKQLKKQDKILEILKEIFKYKAHSNWLFDYIKSKEQRSMIVDWLSEDLNNDR